MTNLVYTIGQDANNKDVKLVVTFEDGNTRTMKMNSNEVVKTRIVNEDEANRFYAKYI